MKFCRINNLEVQERRVNYNDDWNSIANELSKKHNLSIPLIEHGGKVIYFKDALEKLL